MMKATESTWNKPGNRITVPGVDADPRDTVGKSYALSIQRHQAGLCYKGNLTPPNGMDVWRKG